MQATQKIPGKVAGTTLADPVETTGDADATPLARRSTQAELGQLAASAGLTVLVLFLLWEVLERNLAPDTALLYLMHYTRGISTSLITAVVVGWVSLRQARDRAYALEAEIQRRTRDLEHTRALLRLVLDSTPASLIVLDQDFRVVEANRAAERLHGLTPIGHNCYDVLVGSDKRCDDCPAVETFASGQIGHITGEHADPRTGEILVVETHRLQLGSGESYVLLVEQSVTEQKKLQARLLHQEKMAGFGLLAAGVAHDMGNPLSSIAAQLQLLDDDKLPDDVHEVVATVREETQRLRRILREMVDFARRRRDEASLVSVQSVVGDALRLLRHDARMREVDVLENYDAEAPAASMIEDHLMQVVFNLLLNALDAMPDGGQLRIEVVSAGGNVVLRLHDSGHGMDRAVLDRCFEALYTTKAPGKGTGLGLSVCRDIIDAAGGSIELHSAPGQGTTAVVVLPDAVGVST